MGDIHDVYENLLQLTTEGDEVAIRKRIKSLFEEGLAVKVESEEESEFHEDGNQSYTETTQTSKLLFNGEVVYEWWASYSGFWGSGGTGWWINEDDTDLEQDVEQLLEYLEVEVRRPDVPQPRLESDDHDAE
jgi:hypothetical protein